MPRKALHPGERMVLVAFRDSPRQLARLEILARRIHIPVPELLRRALAELLDKIDQKGKINGKSKS